jgi:hypothetical protein
MGWARFLSATLNANALPMRSLCTLKSRLVAKGPTQEVAFPYPTIQSRPRLRLWPCDGELTEDRQVSPHHRRLGLGILARTEWSMFRCARTSSWA